MRLYVALALGGLPLGAMYALQALGIVVIYKTSKVFTFATGAVGMLAAYVASWLAVDLHVPVLLAAATATLTGVGVGLVMESLTIRPVRGAVNRTVVTLAWLIGLQGLVGMIWGNTSGRAAAKVFSSEPLFTLKALNLAYGVDQAAVLVLALVLAGGLGVFFRRSTLGTAMRAVADDPEAAGLLGMPVRRVSLTAWGLGCGLSALSGVLVTPLLSSLDTLTLVVFTIQALAAALVGRLQSLPLTLAGGLGLGLVQPVVRHALQSHGLSGTNELVALAVVLVALVARRRSGRGDVGGGGLVPASQVAMPPLRLLAPVLGAGAVLAVVLPLTGSTTFTIDLSLVGIWALAVLSIVLLTGVVGQVSVCQGVFMALGGFGAAIAVDHGVPFLLALLIGGGLAAFAAALVALPALRLQPLELAIATLSLAFTADTFLYKWTPLVSASSGRPIDRPGFASVESAGGQRAYFWVVLAVLVLGGLAVASLRRGRTGAALTALRSSEAATAAMGFSVASAKLRGFAAAGFLAGVAGALYAGLNQIATGAAFDTTRSITLLAYAVVAGVGSVPGAVLGGIIVTLSTLSFGASTDIASGFSASAISAVTGVVLVLVLRFAPEGVTGLAGRVGRRTPKGLAPAVEVA